MDDQAIDHNQLALALATSFMEAAFAVFSTANDLFVPVGHMRAEP